jgi:hypothetical protein
LQPQSGDRLGLLLFSHSHPDGGSLFSRFCKPNLCKILYSRDLYAKYSKDATYAGTVGCKVTSRMPMAAVDALIFQRTKCVW